VKNSNDGFDLHERKSWTGPLGTLAYRDIGPPDAPPLVVLHGFTGSSDDAESLAPGLERRHRLLVPDLPGHGVSDIIECEEGFGAYGQRHLILSWLDSIGVSRFKLLGYSMGGRLALQIATQNSERIDSLALVSTTAGMENETERQVRIAADKEILERLEMYSAKAFLEFWLDMPLFKSLHGALQAQGKSIDEEIQRRSYIYNAKGLSRSLEFFGTGAMPPVWNELDRINAPTLVVAGRRDPKFLAISERLEKRIWLADRKLLSGGHSLGLEVPEELQATLESFFAIRSRDRDNRSRSGRSPV
jgi:2-succinyl-6-hydroxy-2,4-cyclohexadiene-1-carboxylate synthase